MKSYVVYWSLSPSLRRGTVAFGPTFPEVAAILGFQILTGLLDILSDPPCAPNTRDSVFHSQNSPEREGVTAAFIILRNGYVGGSKAASSTDSSSPTHYLEFN